MDREFWLGHLAIPLGVFLAAVFLQQTVPVDRMLADWIYALEGHRWSLRDAPLFSMVLHTGAQKMMVGVGLAVIVAALASLRIERLRPWRRPLAYLAVVMPLSALLVAGLKEITHVDCPWDLLRYGGSRPFVGLFQHHSGAYPYGRCFPAGHASGGYALVALYFFLREVAPDKRWAGLAIGLGAGMLFGMVQQLRGAHFLSHDLWALAICWFNSLLGYRLFFGNRHRTTKGASS